MPSAISADFGARYVRFARIEMSPEETASTVKFLSET
jgi:hypothetical protein